MNIVQMRWKYVYDGDGVTRVFVAYVCVCIFVRNERTVRETTDDDAYAFNTTLSIQTTILVPIYICVRTFYV